ncbi:hypothetical protein BV25DRAFT_1824566 [Artomyces pyxidatus]|uniref:Uncharacterized protein n=1 Tax=Artomyces pyxidatus TaxID=48021 RepID=A0ACB8T624_9AGAM|nr:hypothetical protein BV25DRAFT_1824566 [Artomyces pyxidatus]
MPAPNRFSLDCYAFYPDNEAIKEVFIQAAGLSYVGHSDRHVVVDWDNTPTRSTADNRVTQIILLTDQAGNHAYYAPLSNTQSRESLKENERVSLGEFTLAERDCILQLAGGIKFSRKSIRNGCRVWITQALFERIDVQIPLVKRVAEAAEVRPVS